MWQKIQMIWPILRCTMKKKFTNHHQILRDQREVSSWSCSNHKLSVLILVLYETSFPLTLAEISRKDCCMYFLRNTRKKERKVSVPTCRCGLWPVGKMGERQFWKKTEISKINWSFPSNILNAWNLNGMAWHGRMVQSIFFWAPSFLKSSLAALSNTELGLIWLRWV